MTCDRFLTQLDALDNESLPIDMANHARSCRACANESAALRAAIGLYRLPDLAGSSDIAPRVAALLPFMPAPRRTVSMRDWIVTGFVIVSSMVLVPLLTEFRALKAVYGSGFTLPVFLALGSLVTLYSGLFVMSHLDDFSRRLKAWQINQHGKAA
ncbi:MAG: hypothetical protein A2Y38_03860 [Spirochaetes bacterium GWB1_59_5]|nr:MAG: hypothetical protein A2Y38_03860 [Spirochaetes bacterium GWB1_59_5]